MFNKQSAMIMEERCLVRFIKQWNKRFFWAHALINRMLSKRAPLAVLWIGLPDDAFVR